MPMQKATELMQPYQERTIAELRALAEKRKALVSFINHSSSFPTLPQDEQHLLSRQAQIMTRYEAILKERIDHFYERSEDADNAGSD